MLVFSESFFDGFSHVGEVGQRTEYRDQVVTIVLANLVPPSPRARENLKSGRRRALVMQQACRGLQIYHTRISFIVSVESIEQLIYSRK